MPVGKMTVGEERDGLRNHPERRFLPRPGTRLPRRRTKTRNLTNPKTGRIKILAKTRPDRPRKPLRDSLNQSKVPAAPYICCVRLFCSLPSWSTFIRRYYLRSFVPSYLRTRRYYLRSFVPTYIPSTDQVRTYERRYFLYI